MGHTSIPKEEDRRLSDKWLKSDLFPRIAEHEPSISGSPSSKCLSNYCPEVTYQSFGFFAHLLCEHGDEIDRDMAYKRHHEKGVPNGSWKWSWSALKPMHFTECPLYSQLVHRSAHPSQEPEIKTSAQKKMSAKIGSKVFIVHGHDEGAREGVARFLARIIHHAA